MTAASVSAALRRAGFNPTGDRNREGLRVTQNFDGRVRVVADLDSRGASADLAADAAAALRDGGYDVDLREDAMYVIGRAS
jgi:hypothetical protein